MLSLNYIKIVITSKKWFNNTKDLILKLRIMNENKKNPKVTVLMPVYNNEKYLREAIESILNQTFIDFEFLIINDGSTDQSLKIIKSYTDPRIKLINNDKNRGLIYSLNHSLDLSRGKYIARMDGDDISLAPRLAQQVAFMDSHTEIAVCGSWIKTIGDHAGFINRFLTNPDDIKANLLFYTSIAHSSVMIRKSTIEQFHLRYDKNYPHCEDYKLWVEISCHTKIANIPKVLQLYRMHKKSTGHTHSDIQRVGIIRIRLTQLKHLEIMSSEEDVYFHNSLQPNTKKEIQLFLNKKEQWLIKILNANKQNKIYNTDSLSKIIYIHWRTICGSNSKEGLKVWKSFIKSPLYRIYNKNKMWDSTKIFIKCLLRR